MPLARASELDRLMACPGSAVLTTIRSKPGVSAEWGTKVHAWCETGELPEGPDGVLLAKKLRLSGLDRLALWPTSGEHEVALAYNVLTGEVQRGPADRHEAAAWKDAFDDEWVVGTADYVAAIFDEWWVDDLKTGRHVTWAHHENQQLLYALAYSLWRFGSICSGRSSVTHWPKYPVADGANRMGPNITVDNLNHYAIKLKLLREAILAFRADPASLEPHLKPGSQCRFCPALTNCSVAREDYR